MPIKVSAISNLVKVGGAALKPEHESFVPQHRNISTITFPSASFSGQFAGSASTITLDIKRRTLHRAKKITVAGRLTVATAAARLAPVPTWPDSWTLTANSGTGDIIDRGYMGSDWVLGTFYPEEVQSGWAKRGLYRHNTLWQDATKLIPTSGVVRFAFPLHAFGLTTSELDISALDEDLQLTISFPANPLSTSAGTPTYTLNDLTLVVEHMEYNDLALELVDHKALNGVSRLSTYLYPDQMSVSATVTASTLYEFTLSALADRKVAFLLVALRSSTARAAQAHINAAILGAGATIDVVSNSGVSLFGGSNTVEAYQKIMEDEGFSTLSKTGWLLVPFCSDLKKALFEGDMSVGYWMSKDSESRLRITPGAAPTNPVFTTTMTNPANDGGNAYMVIKSKNHTVVSETQAFNVSAADAKTDLDASYAYLDSYGAPTSTFSATPLATTSTLTWSAGGAPGDVTQLPEVSWLPNTLNDGTVSEIIVSQLWSTIGVPGFVTGTYTVSVWAFCFRHLELSPGGRLRSFYATSADDK